MKTIQDIDLRKLANMESAERAFVSCYLCPPDERDWLARRAKAIEHVFDDAPDDLEHFQAGMQMVQTWLDGKKTDQPAIAVFACWALDFVEGYALPVEVERRLRLGPAPLIRPIAEIADEHEDLVLVTADNDAAEIHLVSLAMLQEEGAIKGDVKNRVKKGGWSQKRYQRRRQNELLHYAKEVVNDLSAMCAERGYTRLVLLGSLEARGAILEQLPEQLRDVLVADDGADLSADEASLIAEAQQLAEGAERREEQTLWERIKNELPADGLAEIGADDVWEALVLGRADQVIIARDLKLAGIKCRQCENVTPVEHAGKCRFCQSDDVFAIDLIDEMVRQAERTSAAVDFADPIEGLERKGGVAALTRY